MLCNFVLLNFEEEAQLEILVILALHTKTKRWTVWCEWSYEVFPLTNLCAFSGILHQNRMWKYDVACIQLEQLCPVSITQLCTLGDELRVTGSRNMASDTDQKNINFTARRFMAVVQYFLPFIWTSRVWGTGFC